MRPRGTILLWLATLATFIVHVKMQPGGPLEGEDRAVTLILLIVMPPLLVFAQHLRTRSQRTIAVQAARIDQETRNHRAILDAAPNAILTVDATGRIAYANPYAAGLFGYGPEELFGKNVDALVPSAFRGQHAGHRAEFARDPRPRMMGANRDLFGQRKDGSLVPIEIGLNQIPGPSGPLVVAAIVDLTERKRAAALETEAARKEQEVARLASVAKFRADLMNMVAHELRTPITPLRLQMTVLRMPEATDYQRTKALEMIDRNVGRLDSQISHMLEASRLESGTTRLDLSDVDLTALAQQAVDAYLPVAAQGGLQLVTEADPRATVRADAGRMAQVFDNLLSNAIKYTPAGGNVRLAVSALPERVRVEVTDSGLGLTAEQQAKLFQPFSQIHKPVQKTNTSTGLGLFITKGLVELHDGRIGVASPGAGQGSTFWFEVPVAGPSMLAHASPQAGMHADLPL